MNNSLVKYITLAAVILLISTLFPLIFALLFIGAVAYVVYALSEINSGRKNKEYYFQMLRNLDTKFDAFWNKIVN